MKVTIYTTQTCPYCIEAKQYLKENNVEYTEKNVAEDENARNEMSEKSGQSGVPVILIKNTEETIIVGFDKPALDKALGI